MFTDGLPSSFLSAPSKLDRQAEILTELIAGVARDKKNIIRTFIHVSGKRPLEAGDLPVHVPLMPVGSDATEFICYEDAGMTTGAFLASQCLRYTATKEPEALYEAQQAFKGIQRIFDLGRSKCAGFFPKPYGGRYSEEISRDQYLFVLSGLAAYAQICDEESALNVREIAAAMADYWMKIDYNHSYFGLSSDRNLSDFMSSLFLGIMSHSYRLGGQRRHWEEYRRLFEQEEMGRRMPQTLRAQFRSGMTYDGAMYFRQTENAVMLKSMAVDELWESDALNRGLWRKSLQAFLDDDLLIAWDPLDGLTYGLVGYDRASDSTFLTAPGVIGELENPLALPDLTWGGLRKRPGSSQTAYAAVVIADRIGSAKAHSAAEAILEKMTVDKFKAVSVPSHEHHVPMHAWEESLFSTAHASYWLWAYWLGRSRGFFAEGEGLATSREFEGGLV